MNLIVGGCDIGSATSKVVILADGKLISYAIEAATAKPEVTINKAMDQALQKAGLFSVKDLNYILGTGYGRFSIPLFNSIMSEIACHAKGANWLDNSIRTIIDIGGQDCKVISVDGNGKVIEFNMNDRCAAGTGRFYESMARVLQCTLEEISSLSNQGSNPANISSQCSVFAESEVITKIYEGFKLEDIIAGINNSVASRLVSMVKRVGLVEKLVLTGGCAKNDGLAMALHKQLGVYPGKMPLDPQIIGAIGAALFAKDKLSS